MYSLILHGRKLVQLQKCRDLRFSLTLVQNGSAFFSSNADVNLKDGQTFTVSYLVKSLGLTTKLAESISKKVSFEEKSNSDSILRLLRSHGFTKSQISNIITDYPQLLVLDAEKSIGPKLKFLQSRGATISELTQVISKVPKILVKKDRSMSIYFDFVKEILQGSKFQTQQGKHESKLRNLSVLGDLGVPQKSLFSLLIAEVCPVSGKEKFEQSLKKVIEMGFDPTVSKFIQAVRIFQSINDKTVQEKVNIYTSLGFSVDDVWKMFKKWPISLTHSEKKINHQFKTLEKCGLVKDDVVTVVKKFPQCLSVAEQNILDSVQTFLGLGFSRDEFVTMVKSVPACIGYSEEKVKEKTEFVVKQMNWPLRALFSYPQVFGYSMEKRIVPRCNVVKALVSKGLLGPELPPMYSVLVCTDEVFLNKYVRKHDDKRLVLELMNVFTGKTRKKHRKL